MKTFLLNSALILSSALMVAPSFAHDPAEHAKTAEAPDCDAMKKMDHSKMDMNDPVMQALMKKCSAKSAVSDPHKGMEGMDHEKMEGMNHGDMEGMDKSKSTSSESHEGHSAH
ncbi:uncharacterized protein involved in copper resistance [Cellvibrio fibrivorans]|jgi:hypothetical protein|uniref:Uncharacterized protein involved in copper resistance n=2 Tax=Cellvibrionaceae TaxID=1706371 RepID=A0ABU1UX42_9GAMM|nr:uncharacterized protein involved in copper resistance [Cellvibrio fibrivorans]